jgi:hypothetical protein
VYFKETANVFDALIVITSLIELPLNLTMIRCAVYLLYWYKSTNTDAKGADRRCAVHLLYWYKSTNTDAKGAARCYDTEVIPGVCEEAGAGGMGVLRSFRLMRILRIGKLVCLRPYALCLMPYTCSARFGSCVSLIGKLVKLY